MNLMKLLCLAGALAGSTAALANPLPVADSGLVSLISGQTAQLNILNLTDPSLLGNTSCSLSISFVDSNGIVLSTSPSVTIPSGASYSYPMSLGLDKTLRAHLDFSDQLIAQETARDPMAGCYRLVPTLEVIDSTGTRAVLTQFIGLPSNQPGEKITNVTICHKPSSPAQKTMSIPMTAMKGHMGHGDNIGNCQK